MATVFDDTFSGASVFPTKKSATPAESTHVWSFVNWPERRIRESGVIARIPGRFARCGKYPDPKLTASSVTKTTRCLTHTRCSLRTVLTTCE